MYSNLRYAFYLVHIITKLPNYDSIQFQVQMNYYSVYRATKYNRKLERFKEPIK